MPSCCLMVCTLEAFDIKVSHSHWPGTSKFSWQQCGRRFPVSCRFNTRRFRGHPLPSIKMAAVVNDDDNNGRQTWAVSGSISVVNDSMLFTMCRLRRATLVARLKKLSTNLLHAMLVEMVNKPPDFLGDIQGPLLSRRSGTCTRMLLRERGGWFLDQMLHLHCMCVWHKWSLCLHSWLSCTFEMQLL